MREEHKPGMLLVLAGCIIFFAGFISGATVKVIWTANTTDTTDCRPLSEEQEAEMMMEQKN